MNKVHLNVTIEVEAMDMRTAIQNLEAAIVASYHFPPLKLIEVNSLRQFTRDDINRVQDIIQVLSTMDRLK